MLKQARSVATSLYRGCPSLIQMRCLPGWLHCHQSVECGGTGWLLFFALLTMINSSQTQAQHMLCQISSHLRSCPAAL